MRLLSLGVFYLTLRFPLSPQSVELRPAGFRWSTSPAISALSEIFAPSTAIRSPAGPPTRAVSCPRAWGFALGSYRPASPNWLLVPPLLDNLDRPQLTLATDPPPPSLLGADPAASSAVDAALGLVRGIPDCPGGVASLSPAVWRLSNGTWSSVSRLKLPPYQRVALQRRARLFWPSRLGHRKQNNRASPAYNTFGAPTVHIVKRSSHSVSRTSRYSWA